MNEIILNEREWTKRAIESYSLGKKPYITIVRVAKYYYEQGFRKNELRRQVEDFMLRCDPTISLVSWDNAITSALNAAERYPLIDVNGVSITDSEMNTIKTLQGILQQRVMFTLLCLAKYGNAINEKNACWVNMPQRDIFSLANVALTSRRQSLMINDLWQLHMIGYSNLVDNVNLQVKILQDGEPELFVTDFRNLGNQYMRHLEPNKYTECESCGLVIRGGSNSGRNCRPNKYCKTCADDIKAARDADRNYIMGLSRQYLKKSQKVGA